MNLVPSAMIDRLRKRLHIGASDILGWLNEEQDYIEKLRSDWLFLIDKDNTISATLALGSDYDLPSDFDHFLAVSNETDDNPMDPMELSAFRRYDPAGDNDTSSPLRYVMLGKADGDSVQKVRLVDAPDGDYTIGFDYYKKMPALEVAIDTPSLVPSSPLLMLGAEIRGRIDNEEQEDIPIIQMQTQRYRELLHALVVHNTLRPDENRRIKPDYRVTTQSFRAR